DPRPHPREPRRRPAAGGRGARRGEPVRRPAARPRGVRAGGRRTVRVARPAGGGRPRVNPFPRLSLGLLYGSLFASAVALVVLVAGDHGPRPVRSAGADTFSRSALGHSAFVETLGRCGI